MTTLPLHNCEHSPSRWCFDCVADLHYQLAAQAHTIKLLGRLGRAAMCIPTTDYDVMMLVVARSAAQDDPATAAVLNPDTERNDHGA